MTRCSSFGGRLLCGLLVLCCLSMMLPSVFAVDPSEKIYDYADLLDKEEEDQLYTGIMSILEKHNMDVAIVTVTDAQGKTPQAYADDFYDENGFGVGPGYDGLLLYVDMGERDVYISTSGSAIPIFTDARIQQMLQPIIKSLGSEDYFAACASFLSNVEKCVIAGPPSSGKDTLPAGSPLERTLARVPLYLLIAVAVGGISVGAMALANRRVSKATQAATYLDRNAVKVTVSQDRFTNTVTNRVKIQTESNSSGGSSTHTSSSGRSHGGGGGKF